MQSVIDHFKYFGGGFCVENQHCFVSIEAPKGEFGVYLASDGSNKPYRCKVRSPSFFHLQGIDFMTRKLMLADVVTVIGTLDVVFGEVDR